MYKLVMSLLVIVAFSACSEQKEPPKTVGSGMKCGAGKCGANMFDGNSALDKKKKNILSQMREDDSRKECVISALSTKEVYECVRNPETKKLSLKCGNNSEKSAPQMKCGGDMKCGAGKCG